MAATYTGPERRIAVNETHIRAAVKEAVTEALRGANLIDGPTHIAHHQAIEQFLALTLHAKRTVVGAMIKGLCWLILAGFAVWVAWAAGHRG